MRIVSPELAGWLEVGNVYEIARNDYPVRPIPYSHRIPKGTKFKVISRKFVAGKATEAGNYIHNYPEP